MKEGKRAKQLKHWQEMDIAYKASGLTVKAFCLLKNIPYKKFLNYRYRAKRSNTRQQTASSLFVPVEIKTPSENIVQTLVDSPNTSYLILQLSNEIRLQIPIETVNASLLRTVFSALEVVR